MHRPLPLLLQQKAKTLSLGVFALILNKFNLSGKVAIVTGGTSGIGRAMALGLAEAGASVIATSRTELKVKAVAEEIRNLGVNTVEVTTDVTSPEEVDKLREIVLAKFGHIDILVNNAGTTIKKKAEELSLSDWKRIIDLNLTSVFICSQIIGKEMINQRSGKIINIASVGSRLALKGSIAYCASKGGVVQLTKVLASEWADYGVEVNAIAPAYFMTPMTKNLLSSEDFMRRLKERIPMNRLGDLEELKGLIVFLASPASSYITGEIIFIDGGWTSYGI